MSFQTTLPVKLVGWSAAMLLVGGGIGAYVASALPDSGNSGSELRSGQQGFTNPLLECDVGGDSISARKQDFSSDLSSFIDLLKQKPDISDVAVYYRDLNNGPVSRVNSDIPFAPASLLKVPIMMAYLSRAESDARILEEKIRFDKPAVLVPDMQFVPPEQSIKVGSTYTVEELIERMIKYSDNEAMALLYERLPSAEQADLYSLLGLNAAAISDPNATLSVRQYSVFFRILFNASYLSRADSEKALKLLSESTFKDGLVAGVPSSVVVAHKFGERELSDQEQFHDCGIVYYPKHPYLLCVMTRGAATTPLLHAIADVSKFVYEKIDAEYGR